MVIIDGVVFVFKQKTAYEMRISDWSSDVCSSDLVEGLGRTHWLVGADGAKSRVAARTGLGRVRDFLYGIEHEYVGARLDEPDALHCFLGRKLAPGYIGWAAQGPTGVQAGLAFRHRPSRTGTPDIDGLLRRVGARLGLPRSEEHTSELQSLMRISYAVFCLKKKKNKHSTAVQVLSQHQ